MADKSLPCNNPYDQLALLAEIIITLRAGFGMKPATYDPSLGALIVPDDYSKGEKAPKAKKEKVKKEKAKEPKVEEKPEEPKAD
jgi:hypothetical protein